MQTGEDDCRAIVERLEKKREKPVSDLLKFETKKRLAKEESKIEQSMVNYAEKSEGRTGIRNSLSKLTKSTLE